MARSNRTGDYAAAQKAVGKLFYDVISEYTEIPEILPWQNSNYGYQKAALEHAVAVNGLERRFTANIFEAAEKIAAISSIGWEQNTELLDLWQQVAQTITYFSENSTKKVASLIIGTQGNLQAFGVNRIPEGSPKFGECYVKGERKQYIVCSERIAIARLFKIALERHDQKFFFRGSELSRMRADISGLTKNIIVATKDGSSLKNSFIFTTAPFCEICGDVIVPLRPRGVIAGTDGKNFTRPISVANLESQWGIPVITLPPSLREPAWGG